MCRLGADAVSVLFNVLQGGASLQQGFCGNSTVGNITAEGYFTSGKQQQVGVVLDVCLARACWSESNHSRDRLHHNCAVRCVCGKSQAERSIKGRLST